MKGSGVALVAILAAVAGLVVGGEISGDDLRVQNARLQSSLEETRAAAERRIAELSSPLHVRGITQPIAGAVEGTRFELKELERFPQLVYRTVKSPPGMEEWESVVPVAKIQIESGVVMLDTNFWLKDQPGKEVRMKFAKDK